MIKYQNNLFSITYQLFFRVTSVRFISLISMKLGHVDNLSTSSKGGEHEKQRRTWLANGRRSHQSLGWQLITSHTPGLHPSLLEELAKTHHNQITRNTQQGNTVGSPVTSTPCFLEILAETALHRTGSREETSCFCDPHNYLSLLIT